MEQKQSSIPPLTEQDTPAQQTDQVPPANESPSLEVILEKLNNMDMCLHKEPWKNALQWSYILANRTEEIIGCPVGSIMEMVEEAKTANEEMVKSLKKVNKHCSIVTVVNDFLHIGAGALTLAVVLLIAESVSLGPLIAVILLGGATPFNSLGAAMTNFFKTKSEQRKLEDATKGIQNFQRLLNSCMDAILKADKYLDGKEGNEYHQQKMLCAAVKHECMPNARLLDLLCDSEENNGARTYGNTRSNFLREFKDELLNDTIDTLRGGDKQVKTIMMMLTSDLMHSPIAIPGFLAHLTGVKVPIVAIVVLNMLLHALDIKSKYQYMQNAKPTKLIAYYEKRSEYMMHDIENLVQLYNKLRECCPLLKHK